MQNAAYTRIEHYWLNSDSFEASDLKVATDQILVRVLNKRDDYWVFHKSLVDESHEQAL
jgi:hypothetical protein